MYACSTCISLLDYYVLFSLLEYIRTCLKKASKGRKNERALQSSAKKDCRRSVASCLVYRFFVSDQPHGFLGVGAFPLAKGY